MQQQQSEQQQHVQQQQASSGSSSNSEATAGVQFSLQDIQRLLAEKEQSDRLQHLQTALLKQQLEALQRTQQNPQVFQQLPSHQQKDLQGSQPSIQQLLSKLQSGQLQSNLAMLQNGGLANQQLSPDAQQLLITLLGGGGGGSSVGAGTHSAPAGSDQFSNLPKVMTDPSVFAQYGLITPPASGAFNLMNQMSAGSRPGSSSQPFMSPLHIPQGNQTGPSSASGSAVPDTRPWDQFRHHPYTPLESPAVTPASVFSNMSIGGMSASEQFFSPLTSPALHPQPNHHYFQSDSGSGGSSATLPGKTQKHKSTTPSASPMALTGKPGPLPRKNRSTTAEARANRTRPSPLMKPTAPSVKKRKENGPSPTAGNGSNSSNASRRDSLIDQNQQQQQQSGSSAVFSQDSSNNGLNYNVSAFTPLMSGQAKPMDASPSEGAASTPSPIDLGNTMGPPLVRADTSKPLTPASIMGIGKPGGSASSSHSGDEPAAATRGRNSALARSRSTSKGSSSALEAVASTSMAKGKTAPKAKGRSSQVKFAADAVDDEEEEEDEAPSRRGSTRTEGDADNGGGADSRRTSHKAAEQKRRDSLKYCFDELRGMLPPITLDEDAPGGSYLGPDGLTEDERAEGFDRSDVADPEYSKTANRAISKVALLRHSNEWIVRLRNRLARRDAALASVRDEVEQFRAVLIANGMMLPPGASAMAAMAHQQQQHDPRFPLLPAAATGPSQHLHLGGAFGTAGPSSAGGDVGDSHHHPLGSSHGTGMDWN